MARSVPTLYMRDILSIVTGLYLSVDEKRIKNTIGFFAGEDNISARDTAKRAILETMPALNADLPNTEACNQGEKQRVLQDWATRKVHAYVAEHGDEVVKI